MVMLETEWVEISIQTLYHVEVNIKFFKQFEDLDLLACIRHEQSEDDSCRCWNVIDEAVDRVVCKLPGLVEYVPPNPALDAWIFTFDASKYDTEWDCRGYVIDTMVAAIREQRITTMGYDRRDEEGMGDI